ncbi:hypothetical protein CEE45_05455 [Candidatus Heimdallarchaeota archaeon B3_Heim]|nr:MAG: hypothetical protein CEE45_05455 [Candidatus Heimdallarchaeota archaeon B3_Heim]
MLSSIRLQSSLFIIFYNTILEIRVENLFILFVKKQFSMESRKMKNGIYEEDIAFSGRIGISGS